METPPRESTIAIYGEICRSHDGIAEFRAKLLALLPLVSGTGIFFSLNNDSGLAGNHFLALGIFGMLVTAGLYLYELRGIQRCISLSNCGKNLEASLLGPDNHTGTFTGEPETAFRIVNNTTASLVVYSTVISAWVYVTFLGFRDGTVLPLVAALLSLFALIYSGRRIVSRQDEILKERIRSTASK